MFYPPFLKESEKYYMINLNTTNCLPAYAVREFRNYGLYRKGSLYKFMFTKEDNVLLSTGAIKLLPFSMCKFYVSRGAILNGKKYLANDIINPEEFEEKVLKILVKTNVVKCEIKEELLILPEEEIVKQAKLYECVGLTFKQASTVLGLDFEVVKTKFELKQGATKKKVTVEDLTVLEQCIA